MVPKSKQEITDYKESNGKRINALYLMGPLENHKNDDKLIKLIGQLRGMLYQQVADLEEELDFIKRRD